MGTKSRVSVDVKNGNVDRAIRIFNKKVYRSGVLQQYNENQEYKKPSTKRREKRRQAKYNQMIEDRKTLYYDLKLQGKRK